MTRIVHSRHAIVALLAALWLVGTLRALSLCLHDPLYAYANSYDETRYTACFGFYPDRPARIPPDVHSPEAPFARFRFIAADAPICYGSSELLFAGTTALSWKIAELAGGSNVHGVRGTALLRWAVLLALSIAFSRAWLGRGESRAALANAALVPLVFADPANTLYLATFYAEWTALIAAYALVALVLLARDQASTRLRFAAIALAAFLLATSKLQHMLLPFALAVVVIALDRARLGRTSWRAVALSLGAIAGLCFQLAQMTRDDALMATIRQYNRADVVFTALAPLSDDPGALLAELGIDPACAAYGGKRAWQLPDLPDRACRGLGDFTHGAELATLLRHPAIAARLLAGGIGNIDPWISDIVGHVEGGTFEKLPETVPSLSRALHASGIARGLVLALPFAALIVLLIRPGPRRGSAALDAVAIAVVVMAATLVVTLLGDGLADTAKQTHLVVNAALATLFAGIILCAPPGHRQAFAIAPPG
ncbi:MAG TPA: hypothetical protein VHE32_01795 [Rhodanobacteraceae bacterium]|nr:hypothetical protein [Rhodanobacteraceae bacterium]